MDNIKTASTLTGKQPREEQIAALAEDVLRLARNRLTVDLRYMANPLSMLSLEPSDVPLPPMTDGRRIVYNPAQVLRQYGAEKENPVRTYLHLVLHCVYMHFYISREVDIELWDLACDIAVEATICDLELPSVTTTRTMQQRKEIQSLKKKLRHMTAEYIYRYFTLDPPGEARLEALRELFSPDSHMLWYEPIVVRAKIVRDGEEADAAITVRKNAKQGAGKRPEQDEDSTGADGKESQGTGNQSGKGKSGTHGNNEQNSAASALRDDWLRAAEQMKIDIETFGTDASRSQGDSPGSGLLENLGYAVRERYDYAAFLRQFGVMGETMKINDEEFDYSYYSFGLDTYGNVPLIEPLEYKDTKRLREFVIAIDTSGSTSGELVKTFLRKTYNILMQRENFHNKINVRIIQCDAEIQDEVKITNRNEFEQYMSNLKVRGLGGTDFRPVFTHVEKLIKDGELPRLKGLIYFTDGYGTFPAHQPSFKTAFVFINDGFEQPEVPVWASRMILEADDIESIRE